MDETFPRPDDKRPGDPSEGVRIIGAEEAAEAMERGDVASRRGDDLPRYGDRPKPPPVGPRPALRFPLVASADPTTIDKPPVRPAGDIAFEPLAGVGEPGRGQRFDPTPDSADGAEPVLSVVEPASPEPEPDLLSEAYADPRLEAVPEPPMSVAPPGAVDPESTLELGPPDAPLDDAYVDAGAAPVALPHWSDPPTGEVPQVLVADEEDDLDAWSSFATSAPRWRDREPDWQDEGYHETLGEGEGWRVGAMDDSRPTHEEIYSFSELDREVPEPAEPEGAAAEFDFDFDAAVDRPHDGPDEWDEGLAYDEAASAERDNDLEVGLDHDLDHDLDDDVEPVPAPRRRRRRGGARAARRRRAPARKAVAQYASGANRGSGTGTGGGSGGGGGAGRGGGLPAGRELVPAVAVGVGLFALALLLFKLGPRFAMVLVVVVLGLAAAELFNAVRRAGYQPAVLLGLVAAVAFPLAVYNAGIEAYPIVLAVTVMAAFAWYLVGASGPEARVVEGIGATLLGVGWVGVLGSFAALLLASPHGVGMLLAAVIATVAYDVGGYVIGRSTGSRPLSDASPNKTVEGLLGGMGGAVLATVVVIGLIGVHPFDSLGAALLVGLAAALAAPLGDLSESLVKRDLGLKDMGSILPGHGGVLDRFDALLFVLPAVYFTAMLFELGPFNG